MHSMNFNVAHDLITAKKHELEGLAEIMDILADKQALLQPDSIDFIGTSLARLSDELAAAAESLINLSDEGND